MRYSEEEAAAWKDRRRDRAEAADQQKKRTREAKIAKEGAVYNFKTDKKKDRGSKRKSYEFFLNEFSGKSGFKSHFIRDPKDWVSKSFNIDKQRTDFYMHCYAKYPVPRFMQNSLHDLHTKAQQRGYYFDWFIDVAQGRSFRKKWKHLFTAKEAHFYLTNSDPALDFKQNVWRMKMIMAGVSHKYLKTLLRAFGDLHLQVDQSIIQRYLNFITFLGKYNDSLTPNIVQELVDFITRSHFRPGWSLKGRTLNSLITLSNEWHAEAYVRGAGTKRRYHWPGFGLPNWTLTTSVTKEHEGKVKTKWIMEEVKDSLSLFAEGRRQKHCVYSYERSCINGQCSIFILREKEEGDPTERHVTIEVSSGDKRIVQQKCKHNKDPDGNQRNIIKRWCAVHGIKPY